MLKNRILLSAATAALVLGFAHGAMAAQQNVGATLDARPALSLSNVEDMNFGVVEFAAAHSGDIRLATNGTIALNAGVGLVLSGGAQAGSVDISSNGTTDMEVSCETSGTLSDGATHTLALSSLQVSAAVGGAAWSAAGSTACAGIGTTPMVAPMGTATIYIGGAIAGLNNNLLDAVYDTTQALGDPVTLQVVYQ